MALAGIAYERERSKNPYGEAIAEATGKMYEGAKDRSNITKERDNFISKSVLTMLPQFARNPEALAQATSHPDWQRDVMPALQRNGLGWLFFQDQNSGSWQVNHAGMQAETKGVFDTAIKNSLDLNFPNRATDPKQADLAARQAAFYKQSASPSLATQQYRQENPTPQDEATYQKTLTQMLGEVEVGAEEDVEPFQRQFRGRVAKNPAAQEDYISHLADLKATARKARLRRMVGRTQEDSRLRTALESEIGQ